MHIKSYEKKTPNVFMFEDDSINWEKEKSEILELSSATRSTLDPDQRTRLIEYELSEVKAVIKHYLLEE